jgi:Protein of unknown function (DUF1592)/Protein of unknown function (DUF1588)/Protein of unknown function (DUF1595)/Protein of unknown function (DUF1585)
MSFATRAATSRRMSLTSRRMNRWVTGCALCLSLTACKGYVGGSAGQTSGGSTVGGPGAGATTGGVGGASTVPSTGAGGAGAAMATCNAAAPDPGDVPLTRLTQTQFLNSVQDLFGKIDLTSVYPLTTGASQFGLAQADVDGVDLDQYQRSAGLVAAAIVGNATSLNNIAPCATGADPRGCAQAFLQGFGTRIYRAPIATADLARHLTLYDAGAATGGYTHGMELLLQGMLQSPKFLYRVELGTGEAVGPTAVKLSGYELAARLSYGLWNSTPDAVLTTAASSGMLATPANVVSQLQRMLQDPRGATVIPQFLGSWIQLPALGGVAKDSTVYPEWTTDLQTAMATQAQQFFTDLLTNQGGTLAKLLTSPTVFVNNKTALLYGTSASALPSDGSFQATQNPATTAAGLLTLPAFLATEAKADQSSPIYRGKFVREQLLCQELPSPPANVPPAPEIMPGVSTRERLKEHEVNATCAACHTLMDPIGLGFESYDGIGRYRTTDGGKPVDASGALTGTDVDGPFNGVAELAAKLATSTTVETCVATQWFRYSMARAEQVADTCSLASLTKNFHDAGADLRTLPLAIVQTPAFLYRRPLAQGSN